MDLRPIRRLAGVFISILSALAAWLCPAPALRAGDALPAADQLLSEVLARLPREPVEVTGYLQPIRPEATSKYNLRLNLSYGSQPSRATYTVEDAFGADLERLTITRNRADPPQFRYETGYPLTNAPMPSLLDAVENTDINWTDLTLSFLWWRNGTTAGQEMIKGQPCYVIVIPAPAGERTPYARVKLWIEEKFRVLLQAEGYAADGQLVRRLSAKSFRKMNEGWMLKDMDVQSFPSKTRTMLRVLEMSGGGPQGEAAPMPSAPDR